MFYLLAGLDLNIIDVTGGTISVLVEKYWYTISDAALILKTTDDCIEHYLQIGKITASVYLPIVTLRKCKVDFDGLEIWHEGIGDALEQGLFNIDNYSSLTWSQLANGSQSANLFDKYIYLYHNARPIKRRKHSSSEYKYCFTKNYLIEKIDIVITQNEINRIIEELGLNYGANTLQQSISHQETSHNIQADKPAKESTRVIETLQKLLAVMAFDAYKYDPAAKSNDTFKDIRKALDDAGVDISDNTIRNHLKAGEKLIPRKSGL